MSSVIKKRLFFCVGTFLILCSGCAWAKSCFIAVENSNVLKSIGDCCDTRYPPGCDLSIALGLMGFDAGVLKDENMPEWRYVEGHETFLNVWKKPHTPRTWIIDSCVWYSGNIIEILGPEKIKDYIEKFDYGNRDVTGMDRHKWPGKLLISPREQVDFLQKIAGRKLPVSAYAYEATEKIIFIQQLIGAWELYGKTGIGEGPGEMEVGWFVGWISKDTRRILFVSCYVPSEKEGNPPSFIAKNKAMEQLFWLIDELEK